MIMNTINKLFWLIAIVVFVASSCKDSEEVTSSDYYYYLDIETEVRLNLTEKAAYIQGLAEGLDLPDSKEGRILWPPRRDGARIKRMGLEWKGSIQGGGALRTWWQEQNQGARRSSSGAVRSAE